MNIKKISNIIYQKLPEKPKKAVILGSGLGNFINSLEQKFVISYSEIKDYPEPTIKGHIGEWVFGYINNVPIICANGRFHMYEGFDMDTISYPIDIFNELKIKQVIITNAAGCLNLDWNVGDFMIIRGYLDFTFRSSQKKSDINKIKLNQNKIDKILSLGLGLGIKIREGIYTWTLGPSYETPAEIKEIIALGGHAVGMSTVPEIIKAIELDLDILCISCLTNYGAGLDNNKLSHEEVLRISKKSNNIFSKLINKIVKEL